jgi:hypothetical protein
MNNASDPAVREAPIGTSNVTSRPISPTNGTDKLGRAKRPERYTYQLKVNLSEPMIVSLRRICRRFGIPEGIGARIAIAQYCASLDPQYRGDNA